MFVVCARFAGGFECEFVGVIDSGLVGLGCGFGGLRWFGLGYVSGFVGWRDTLVLCF